MRGEHQGSDSSGPSVYFYSVGTPTSKHRTLSSRATRSVTLYLTKVCECYRLVITELEATNCFSINFQVFSNDNQLNFTKILYCIKKAKAIVSGYHFRDGLRSRRLGRGRRVGKPPAEKLAVF